MVNTSEAYPAPARYRGGFRLIGKTVKSSQNEGTDLKAATILLATAGIALGGCASSLSTEQRHELGCAAGTISGAVIGGAAGSLVGAGSGQIIATSAGAAAGAFVGNRLTCA